MQGKIATTCKAGITRELAKAERKRNDCANRSACSTCKLHQRHRMTDQSPPDLSAPHPSVFQSTVVLGIFEGEQVFGSRYEIIHSRRVKM